MNETARRFPDEVASRVLGRQMMFSYAGGSVIPAVFGLIAAWAVLGAVGASGGCAAGRPVFLSLLGWIG